MNALKDVVLGLMLIIGAGILTYGCHEAWSPLGWIVLGTLTIIVAWRLI